MDEGGKTGDWDPLQRLPHHELTGEIVTNGYAQGRVGFDELARQVRIDRSVKKRCPGFRLAHKAQDLVASGQGRFRQADGMSPGSNEEQRASGNGAS